MSRPQNSIMFMLIKDVFTYESQCLMNKELGKTSVY